MEIFGEEPKSDVRCTQKDPKEIPGKNWFAAQNVRLKPFHQGKMESSWKKDVISRNELSFISFPWIK